MKKVAFHTLGCKVNQYETEAMEELFAKNDYIVVGEDEIADVYVINTCTVTNLSDRKSRQFIRKSKKINENSVVAVVGCYSQVSPEEVENIEGVDVVIGTSQRDRIVELCQQAAMTDETINIVKPVKTLRSFEKIQIDDVKSRTRAFLKIQDGCSQFCSYCIIPYARGPVRSREYDDILDEAGRLAKAGFKEIVLTGIHVASYGKETKSKSLKDVILGISKIDGIERIRMSSVEPGVIDEEFMEAIVESKKTCDHFHLSLQSGSDSVLKRMNRKYDTAEYMEKVELIRSYMPGAGLTTDIIVGFPGETQDEFAETLNFIKRVGFSRIHVFKYSPRKGTPAAAMENQVSGEIKNQRSEQLINIGDELAKEFHEKFINISLPVLYEDSSRNKNTFEGYTTNYIRVKTPSQKDIIGDIINTELGETDEQFMIGNII
ncbi:MAG: tRNA (N(6)-L-threonylcarbamoyladenosine(37)-C(2))-methylthiotransferase MtaB [Gudongella sp.]|jgi:threonylcarbamoyladenosine tRNA methylthiotransferase MtaB|nr:tRNA (N(6)-L-threonylcarbamoyladenosine(37)-C(2))-methylthiotransferase MtaB [Gudongella sp.]